MSGYGGYMGKILKIDLSSETISEYHWSNEERKSSFGGKAMAIRILSEHLTGQETAFSENNWIVITTGPLTGSGAPGSLRFDIASLSPKDDLPAFSNCGGNFGLQLKKAGYDALILTGQCTEKRWLEINENEILFHDANELWGMETSVCQQNIGSENSGKLCIGPAGENLVRYASVITGSHTAGRAGIGAVFGWKKLKAITVSGNRAIPVHEPEKNISLNREWHSFLMQHTQSKEPCKSYCTGCPIHCAKHNRGECVRLDELGLDAIAAEDAVAWAREQGWTVSDIYEDIAFRRGIGDKLAEGVPHRKGKGGKRRGGSYRAIAEAFCLPFDDPQTEVFCRTMTEAISAAGQCMFTVNALPPDEPMRYVLPLLNDVTGMGLELDDLLRIGNSSIELERQLRKRFGK